MGTLVLTLNILGFAKKTVKKVTNVIGAKLKTILPSSNLWRVNTATCKY